jgi:hypothetical protein
MDRERAERLLGMGWVGWVGVGVFCALGVVATQVDVRYAIQSWITETFGVGALYAFTLWISYTSYFAWAPAFSILTLLAVLPALHIAGRRWSWVVGVLLLAYVVAWPLSHATGGPHVGRMIPLSMVPAWVAPGAVGADRAIHVEYALISGAALGVLVILTRSKLVGAGCGVATVLSLLRTPLDDVWYWWIVNGVALSLSWALWHVAVLLPLYVWAVGERRRARPAWMCACGYDLRGSRRVCPECGRECASWISQFVAWIQRIQRMAEMRRRAARAMAVMRLVKAARLASGSWAGSRMRVRRSATEGPRGPAPERAASWTMAMMRLASKGRRPRLVARERRR